MSQVYVSEPATSGKVILHTTVGDFDIELWAKECPKACRNFIQLCTDGYYDNVIFHRIIKGFMAQTGDPTGTGHGGESIYGEEFEDEFHQRIKFAHRGRIACASLGPNTNSSQFFVTFDRCDWLDRKHTIFGKLVGNTIFNAMRLQDFEVDSTDRPLEPPSIKSAEVISHPFDDIFQRVIPKVAAPKVDKSKKKGKKDLKLLSFGEQAAADEEELMSAPTKIKLKSAHDVLQSDSRLRNELPVDPDADEKQKRVDASKSLKEKVVAATRAAETKAKADNEDDAPTPEEEWQAVNGEFDEHMRNKVRAQMAKGKAARESKPDERDGSVSEGSEASSDNSEKAKRRAKKETEKEIRRLKRELKGKSKSKRPRDEDGSESGDDSKHHNAMPSQPADPNDPYARINMGRLKLKKKPKLKKAHADASRQLDVQEKFEKFSKSLREERSKHGQSVEVKAKEIVTRLTTYDDESITDDGWKTSHFECQMAKRRRLEEQAIEEAKAVNDYISIDPRDAKASESKSKS